MTRAIIVWGNWGPYHHARYAAFRRSAAARGLCVEGIELFPSSGIYAWKNSGAAGGYAEDGVHRLNLGANEMAFRPWQLTRQLAPLVRRLRPRVAFVPSYWHWSLFLNAVARSAGARIVMMNESHGGTERARGFKKAIKRRIVSSFHAALVGGSPHRRYFHSLGLPAGRIFLGYDAVDNTRFAAAAAGARAHAAEHRARLGLPAKYFLSLGRLVEKKNLPLLVRAYAQLRLNDPRAAHHLVFVGSGEKEADLRALCAELALPVIDHAPDRHGHSAPPPDGREVHFFGFRQIDENPIFYALATAFVLPSLREEWGLVVNEAMACGLPVLVSETAGCAEDLVASDENGYTFHPASAAELAGRLQQLADSPALVAQLGAASARRIADWGCERFADGAIRAAEAALHA